MPAKILSLVWYKVLPPKFGGQKGIAIFNKYLSHYCTLVCLSSKDNEDPGDLPYRLMPELPLGRRQVLSPFYWRKISRTTKKEKPFLLILEHPYHGLAAFLRADIHNQALFFMHTILNQAGSGRSVNGGGACYGIMSDGCISALPLLFLKQKRIVDSPFVHSASGRRSA